MISGLVMASFRQRRVYVASAFIMGVSMAALGAWCVQNIFCSRNLSSLFLLIMMMFLLLLLLLLLPPVLLL